MRIDCGPPGGSRSAAGGKPTLNRRSLTPPRKYSANRKIGSFHYVHKTSFGNYSFVCVDATLTPGPKRPYNFFGILEQVRLCRARQRQRGAERPSLPSPPAGSDGPAGQVPSREPQQQPDHLVWPLHHLHRRLGLSGSPGDHEVTAPAAGPLFPPPPSSRASSRPAAPVGVAVPGWLTSAAICTRWEA